MFRSPGIRRRQFGPTLRSPHYCSLSLPPPLPLPSGWCRLGSCPLSSTPKLLVPTCQACRCQPAQRPSDTRYYHWVSLAAYCSSLALSSLVLFGRGSCCPNVPRLGLMVAKVAIHAQAMPATPGAVVPLLGSLIPRGDRGGRVASQIGRVPGSRSPS